MTTCRRRDSSRWGRTCWRTAEGIPWLGDPYRVAVITHRDNILLQTYDPDAMRAARDGKESPDGVAPVTVVVDGLAQTLQKIPAQPVQLALWSPSTFSYGNTMRAPLAAEGGLNSAKPMSGEPLPPYTAALFADTQAGDRHPAGRHQPRLRRLRQRGKSCRCHHSTLAWLGTRGAIQRHHRRR